MSESQAHPEPLDAETVKRIIGNPFADESE